MGEKERAEALLQAAGVVGVAVQESPETVTMTRAEADALRAAAAPAAVGAPAPAGLPTQVAQLGAELAAGTTPGTPPGSLPEGILSEEELAAELEHPRSERGMSYAERMKHNEQVTDSYTYHARQGQK